MLSRRAGTGYYHLAAKGIYRIVLKGFRSRREQWMQSVLVVSRFSVSKYIKHRDEPWQGVYIIQNSMVDAGGGGGAVWEEMKIKCAGRNMKI